MASSEAAEHRVADEEDTNAPAEDEDTGAKIAPIVKLEEVAVTTGEEDEDPILDLKAKLYRFDKDGNQWKERGAGSVKFLKHKVTGKVRLVMRQSKTLKICANHLVLPAMTVQEHTGNEKSCVWHATDFADGELKDELFCIRFATVENCKTFMEKFQDVAASQNAPEEEEEEEEEAAAAEAKQEEDKGASDTAELLEKLTVEEKKGGENEPETKPKVEADEKAEETSAST
ncbi:Ran-binding protein 1 homolog b-like protein [Drosera capensis]